MTRAENISEFLGLTRSTAGLLFMVVLVRMGERMAERFLPIYLPALGGGVISIGLLNGMDNFLSAISLPATMGLIAKVLPTNKRTMGVTMDSLVRRFPMALGPILAAHFYGRSAQQPILWLPFYSASQGQLALCVMALWF